MTTEVQQDQELTPDQMAEQEERDFLAATKGESDPEPESTSAPKDGAADPGEGDDNDDLPLAAEGDGDIDLSSLPPSVVEKLEAQMMEKLAPQIEQRLSGRIRNIEGHIGGLKHNLQQLSTAAKAAEQQGAEAPDGHQMREAMQSGEKMARLKEDFPEFADALEEMFSGIATQMPQVDVSSINQRIDQTAQTMPQLMNRARQMARLDNAHPEWESTIQSERYLNWLSNQPPETQALTHSENAADAIKVLDAYAESMKPASDPDLTAQRRQNRLESAVSPTDGRSAQRRQPKTEHEEFLAAFNG
ncbi:hypothetical protein [Marinobacterium litorale]|uniref:hypothetical protein n=1 Tax=Marinobacterium litorale TaxID=404770 RepID=UPI00040FC6DF|nr:hypothetical protein [Marinobacterium litorale]